MDFLQQLLGSRHEVDEHTEIHEKDPAVVTMEEINSAPDTPMTSPADANRISTIDEYFQEAKKQAETRPASKVNSPRTAIPVGRPRTGEHVSKLYNMCHRRNITPIFDVFEPVKYRFSARLRLGPEGSPTIEDHGLYATKKEAKEAVAERGCSELKDVPKSVKHVVSQKFAAAPSNAVNWIGLLLEFCQFMKISEPLYQAYVVGNGFSCTVKIEQASNRTFGTPVSVHGTKKAAKASSAREAVEFLRSTGLITDDYSIARTKTDTPLTQQAPRKSETGTSYAQQVVELCPILGLSAIEYRLEQDPNNNAMYSGSALFTMDFDNHGPIGHVDRVFGRKNAKEELAKDVLAFLVKLKEQRMAEAQLA